MTDKPTYDINKIFGHIDVKGERHDYCDEESALAHMLLGGVLFSNGRKYVESFDGDPLEIGHETVVLFVNCNDVFAWGCADSEELPHGEIGPLFREWHASPRWGAARWCARRRNQQPQPPVVEAMKRAGAWDAAMEALGGNTQDAEVHALFRQMAGAAPGPENRPPGATEPAAGVSASAPAAVAPYERKTSLPGPSGAQGVDGQCAGGKDGVPRGR